MKIINPSVLEKYRLKLGLSSTQLSEKMGRTPGWYSRIKSGDQALTPKYIEPMAKVFGVKPEKLAREYYSPEKLEDTSILI